MKLTQIISIGMLFATPSFAMTKEIQAEVNGECISVSFEQEASETIPCDLPLSFNYTISECSTKKLKERGSNLSKMSCHEPGHWDFAFRTSKGIFLATLAVSRENKGRMGWVSQYRVVGSVYNLSAAELPEPMVFFSGALQPKRMKTLQEKFK